MPLDAFARFARAEIVDPLDDVLVVVSSVVWWRVFVSANPPVVTRGFGAAHFGLSFYASPRTVDLLPQVCIHCGSLLLPVGLLSGKENDGDRPPAYRRKDTSKKTVLRDLFKRLFVFMSSDLPTLSRIFCPGYHCEKYLGRYERPQHTQPRIGASHSH